jgi:hypothetical protein
MKPSKTVLKKVATINALIETANSNGLTVTDTQSTWQTEYKYKPLKYSRGCLFIKSEELDLYNRLKYSIDTWNKESDQISYEEDIKATLSNIKRMYITRLNHFNKYGY